MLPSMQLYPNVSNARRPNYMTPMGGGVEYPIMRPRTQGYPMGGGVEYPIMRPHPVQGGVDLLQSPLSPRDSSLYHPGFTANGGPGVTDSYAGSHSQGWMDSLDRSRHEAEVQRQGEVVYNNALRNPNAQYGGPRFLPTVQVKTGAGGVPMTTQLPDPQSPQLQPYTAEQFHPGVRIPQSLMGPLTGHDPDVMQQPISREGAPPAASQMYPGADGRPQAFAPIPAGGRMAVPGPSIGAPGYTTGGNPNPGTPGTQTLSNGKTVYQYEDTQYAKDARREAYIARQSMRGGPVTPNEQAQARANTVAGAQADYFQGGGDDARQLRLENANLRNQLQRYQGGEQRTDAAAGAQETKKEVVAMQQEGLNTRKAATTQASAEHTTATTQAAMDRTKANLDARYGAGTHAQLQEHPITAAEVEWLSEHRDKGVGDILAIRKGKMPGDPTTRPSAVTQPTSRGTPSPEVMDDYLKRNMTNGQIDKDKARQALIADGYNLGL